VARAHVRGRGQASYKPKHWTTIQALKSCDRFWAGSCLSLTGDMGSVAAVRRGRD
jgi:hypothetical protein